LWRALHLEINATPHGILEQLIIASQGSDSILKRAIGSDWKGKLSPLLYAAAIPLAFWWEWISLGLYVFVALLWLVPDRRIEHVLSSDDR
jgi:hypothetical protein